MEEFCRPATLDDLKVLVRSLNAQEGDYLLIGGYALFAPDIMLNACGETYETMTQYAETVDLDGLPIRTVNLEGLLRTK